MKRSKINDEESENDQRISTISIFIALNIVIPFNLIMICNVFCVSLGYGGYPRRIPYRRLQYIIFNGYDL